MIRNISLLLLALVVVRTTASPVSPFTLISNESDYLLHYSGQASLKGHFIAEAVAGHFAVIVIEYARPLIMAEG
jgi:hypothetical protein